MRQDCIIRIAALTSDLEAFPPSLYIYPTSPRPIVKSYAVAQVLHQLKRAPFHIRAVVTTISPVPGRWTRSMPRCSFPSLPT
jgi:hypothetical protein